MNNKRIKTLLNRRQKINVITKSSSGYAEETEDWFECTCVECGKHFHTDQENRKYINGTFYVKSDYGTHEILKVN